MTLLPRHLIVPIQASLSGHMLDNQDLNSQTASFLFNYNVQDRTEDSSGLSDGYHALMPQQQSGKSTKLTTAFT
jgi:hypothetical protein